ncbi:C4BPA protein, partial [Todus mexicanus]|nr:C4BPA protein [Todus mexicanus]
VRAGERLRHPLPASLTPPLPAGECQHPPRLVFAEPPAPPEPPYAAGTVLRYRCRPGYTPDGGKSPLVTCNPNSTWSVQPDFCIGKSCAPPHIANGYFEYSTNLQLGATITYKCNLGYRLAGGVTSAKCVLQGNEVSWDADPFCESIPCLPPPAIENGQHSDENRGDFNFGMSVTYSCNQGLALIGEPTIHCTSHDNLNGEWSGPAPECRAVSCRNPEVPNGRRLSGFGTEHTYKDTVTFECNPGHVLSGSSVVTCEADSDWKPPLPTCEPIYCGPAPRFPFAELATAAAERSPAGTELRYRCKPGYTAARGKASVVTCQDDASWSADPDFCTRQQCAPLTIKNGQVIADNFLFETVATFSCHPGYELKESSSVKCVVSGNGVDWDKAPPSCERKLADILCEEPPTINNGIHNGTKGTAFFHGSVVVYKCRDGFTLAGAASVRCEVDRQYQGVWSAPAPECRGDSSYLSLVGIFPLLLAMLIMNI